MIEQLPVNELFRETFRKIAGLLVAFTVVELRLQKAIWLKLFWGTYGDDGLLGVANFKKNHNLDFCDSVLGRKCASCTISLIFQ